MTELLSPPAFMLWGSPVSWLELVASTLALAMVGCNMREIHWGWPLAIVSSLLYVAVFAKARIYGDASLQVFFACVALWGWAQWLRGHRADGSALQVSRLSPRGLALTLAACAFAWPAVALFLGASPTPTCRGGMRFPPPRACSDSGCSAASTSRTCLLYTSDAADE